MEFDHPSSQKDRSLPMIVNLRGDEELVDLFNWDADQAMEFLAIKRSRLTQISGKELRVGRIRRDRYLRPVYREVDVRDYQEWTRATATHQSSSRAIEHAIDSLDDRFSDLFVVLQEKLQQFETRSSQLLIKQLQQVQKAVYKDFQQLSDAEPRLLQTLTMRFNHGHHQILQQDQAMQKSLKASQVELQTLREILTHFHQDLRGLLAVQNNWRREMLETWLTLSSKIEAQESLNLKQNQSLTEYLRNLQSSLQDLHASQVQLQSSLKPELAPLKPRLLFSRRLPRPLHKRRFGFSASS